MNTDGPSLLQHMQILTSGPHCRGENGTFIVGARPANAISGEIKWERWGEREISIFYEPFPLLPLGSLWLSASNRIPSSLIPFSKNVIRKSPFGLSAATLSSCAGSAAQSYIIASLGSSLSLTLFSQTLQAVSSGRGKTHIPRPFLLHMIASAARQTVVFCVPVQVRRAPFPLHQPPA